MSMACAVAAPGGWSCSDYWSPRMHMPSHPKQLQHPRMSLLAASQQGFFRYALPVWRAQDKSPIAVLRMDGGAECGQKHQAHTQRLCARAAFRA